MSLGGGPPALSLLTGLARGVTEREKRRREEERQAVLNRLREAQIGESRARVELGRQQEERLRIREERLREQERAARAEAARSRDADIRARHYRAREIMEAAEAAGEPISIQQALARVHAESEGYSDPYPSPREIRQEARESEVEQEEREREKREFEMSEERHRSSMAEDRREREEDEAEQRAQDRIREIINDDALAAALARTYDPDEVVDIAGSEANMQDGEPRFSTQELLQAREEIGGPRGEDPEQIAHVIRGRTQARDYLNRAGGDPEAAMDLLYADLSDEQVSAAMINMPGAPAQIEAAIDELERLIEEKRRSQGGGKAGEIRAILDEAKSGGGSR